MLAVCNSVMMCLVGQNNADLFHDPALQSELSQDNAVVEDADDDEHHIVVEEADEDTETGVASGDEDHVVEATLQSDDMLVTTPTQRQHSTTEYLPGMLHSNSPPGLLPKFPSWSLLQLGEYSSYNPSTGNYFVIFCNDPVTKKL